MDGIQALGIGSNDVGGSTPPVPFDVDLQTYLVAQLAAPVYPGHVPQAAPLPAYSYFLVSEDPYYTLAGPSAGLTSATYQIDVWAGDYLTASTMELQLRNALHGFRGYMGSSKVWTSRLETRHGQAEPSVSGGDDWIQHVICEYLLMYRESVPVF